MDFVDEDLFKLAPDYVGDRRESNYKSFTGNQKGIGSLIEEEKIQD